MPNEPLSEHESAQLAGRLAELSAAQLPLAPGLRAAAAELDGGRLARAMELLATDLERGQTLEQALAHERGRFPATFTGLVAAGVRTGRLGEVLEEFAGFRQFVADMRRDVWTALAYPLFLVVLTIGLFAVFADEIAPLLADTYRGFRIDMVGSIRALDGLHTALPYVLAAAGLVVLLAIVMHFFRSLPIVWRVVTCLPAIGRLWKFGGMAEFARLLRNLLEHDVPLPEALRLTAGGIANADVAAGCRYLATRIESGESLATALQRTSQFGPIERPIIAWGEQHGALPAALATVADVNVRRLRVWSTFLRSSLPLVLLLFIFVGILFVLSSFTAVIALMSSLY